MYEQVVLRGEEEGMEVAIVGQIDRMLTGLNGVVGVTGGTHLDCYQWRRRRQSSRPSRFHRRGSCKTK